MNNKALYFLALLFCFISSQVFAQSCENTVFRDALIKKKYEELLSRADLKLTLDKYSDHRADADDYYFLGMAHRLGMYLEKDISKSVGYFKQGLKILNRTKSPQLYRRLNHQLGLIGLLCGQVLIERPPLYYFSEAASAESHREALYFKSIIELYSLGEISGNNKNISGDIGSFLELLGQIRSAASHGFALANFELLYVATRLNTDHAALKAMKQRLFKTNFFEECDFLHIQKNLRMPYKSEIEHRLELIKSMSPSFFESCNYKE